MTSILKVDQIQTAAGGVPTAADLGINTSGTVLKTYALQGSSTDFALSTTEVLFETINITTSGNSYLIWFIDTGQYIKTSTATNPYFRLYVDGVQQGDINTVNNSSWNHHWYGQNAARETQFNYFVSNTLSAGTHTCEIYASRYSTGTITLCYQARPMRFLVQEVAA